MSNFFFFFCFRLLFFISGNEAQISIFCIVDGRFLHITFGQSKTCTDSCLWRSIAIRSFSSMSLESSTPWVSAKEPRCSLAFGRLR
ncbi:hypothetical protein K450DRAFT_245908 [Umbelopsis ramanniana AG]|uniref:Secreted protein n=1 Tax=Umbelopsis ramanniana AG TaxID=1314678 RepID=A0AAD5E8G7_UMBRA|nr:uncharacterized protein K450DRAFT_245908 [Umbelopsis ramanniana AG]KAI8578652.1 hypothetical protein K450DRAFT_245908 [Umbelopsis ramanniana AG]